MAFRLFSNIPQQYLDSNGDPLASGTLTFELAGTSTAAAIYSDEDGTAAANPLTLDARGEITTTKNVWGDESVKYKITLKDSGGSTIWAQDDILVGTALAGTGTDWVLQASTPVYSIASAFTVVGDITSSLDVGQRIKIDDAGTDKYGYISLFSYSNPNTTVTIVLDNGGTLSGGTLNSFSIGLIGSVNSSLPRGFYPAESGETGVVDYTWPRGYVQRYGAKGDGTTDDLTAINNAMSSQPSVAGTVFWPYTTGGYACSDKITLSASQDELAFIGVGSRYTVIKFTSATSDGLYFAGEHDKFTSENIEYKSTNTSTGIGINSPNTGSATPLRDLLVKDFQITGFKSGLAIAGGLNIAFKNGLVAGQGKTVSGGVGGEFGSAAEAINHVTCDQVYFSSFETNIDNKNTSSIALNNCLSGFANKAFVNPGGGIAYVNNMYWDSYNNIAFENAGYMPNPTYLKSSQGTQTYTNTAETRFYQGGHIRAFIRAYIASNNQASIPTDTATKVTLNTETYDSEGQFYLPSADGIASATIFEGGTGYAVSDVLAVAGGTSGAVTVATESGGVVTGITVSAAGTGYKDSQNVATSYGGAGTGLTLDVIALTKIYSATVNAAGTEYALDDTITVAGGTNGDLIVQTVDGAGSVTGLTLSGSVTSSGYAAATAAATTGGTGSGCTVDTVMEESYAFRAIYPGTFRVKAQITWRVGTANKTYKAMIYKNGLAITTNQMSGASSVVQQQSQTVEDIIYLDIGDYINVYVQHDEGVDSEIYFNDSFVIITDA